MMLIRTTGIDKINVALIQLAMFLLAIYTLGQFQATVSNDPNDLSSLAALCSRFHFFLLTRLPT